MWRVYTFPNCHPFILHLQLRNALQALIMVLRPYAMAPPHRPASKGMGGVPGP